MENSSKRKSFLTLSPSESINLDRIVYLNANSLKRDAILIAEKNHSYNTAISLMILSIEEMIKAIFILLHSKEYDVYKIKQAKKIFNDHKTRHNYANLINAGSGISELIIICEKINENSKKYKEQQKKPLKERETEQLLENLNSFIRFICLIFSAEKIESFNDKKNFGFYIDLDDVILNKRKFENQEFYKDVFDIQNRITRAYKLISIVHHPKIENRTKKEDYLKLKLNLIDLLTNIENKDLY